jgi:hypothetical protein
MEKPEKKLPNKPEKKINEPIQKIEYIRKNNRRNGRKKGVLWAGVDPKNKDQVIIGFTLCHSIDRFDYININKKSKGFGLNTAKIRAEKWRFHNSYFIQKTYTEEEFVSNLNILKYVNPNKMCVEVAPSVLVKLKPFIERCRKYYKDKGFPEWIEKIEKNEPYPDVLKTEQIFTEPILTSELE